MSHVTRTFMLLVFLVLPLIVLSVVGHPAHAICVADGAAGVLECFTTAYAQRDIEAFSQLLASDFVFVSIGPLRQMDQDRAAELETIGRIFASPAVESMSLSFDPAFDVVPGGEPGTWKLDNLKATLSLRATASGQAGPKDYSVTVRMSLYVRQVASPTPHFEVFREEDYQPE